MSRWMGVDLGNARVGIAVSDPELSVATPLENVEVWSDYFEALNDVVDLVHENGITTVVVGWPLNMDGSEGKAAKKARRWSQQLEKRLAAPQEGLTAQEGQEIRQSTEDAVSVRLKDERLTTVVAHRQLHQAGRSSLTHRSVVDQQSAVLILQSALDERARGNGQAERETHDGRA
ncbi:MAG: Holliday junction resolvase RuvX [Bifidobacteriaceae bacterium]|nr:Holliday junction resolvase RuvX [Bifidobacteriaceae bacterium]MCI1978584.1 Holliday junction resolvase RuvX [Bifidobacteriaceae bacterium]